MSGVAPERLEELYRGRAIDIWAALQEKDPAEAERVSHNFWVLARLRPTIYYKHGPDRTAASIARGERFRAPVRSKLPAAELNVNVISQSYFAAMGVSLISGQAFTRPPASGECRVAVINQEAARLYFGRRPLDAAVIDDRGVRTAIAGVVDAKPLAVFERRAEPAIYFPMLQDALPRMTLIVVAPQCDRTSADRSAPQD